MYADEINKRQENGGRFVQSRSNDDRRNINRSNCSMMTDSNPLKHFFVADAAENDNPRNINNNLNAKRGGGGSAGTHSKKTTTKNHNSSHPFVNPTIVSAGTSPSKAQRGKNNNDAPLIHDRSSGLPTNIHKKKDCDYDHPDGGGKDDNNCNDASCEKDDDPTIADNKRWERNYNQPQQQQPHHNKEYEDEDEAENEEDGDGIEPSSSMLVDLVSLVMNNTPDRNGDGKVSHKTADWLFIGARKFPNSGMKKLMMTTEKDDGEDEDDLNSNKRKKRPHGRPAVVLDEDQMDLLAMDPFAAAQRRRLLFVTPKDATRQSNTVARGEDLMAERSAKLARRNSKAVQAMRKESAAAERAKAAIALLKARRGDDAANVDGGRDGDQSRAKDRSIVTTMAPNNSKNKNHAIAPTSDECEKKKRDAVDPNEHTPSPPLPPLVFSPSDRPAPISILRSNVRSDSSIPSPTTAAAKPKTKTTTTAKNYGGDFTNILSPPPMDEDEDGADEHPTAAPVMIIERTETETTTTTTTTMMVIHSDPHHASSTSSDKQQQPEQMPCARSRFEGNPLRQREGGGEGGDDEDDRDDRRPREQSTSAPLSVAKLNDDKKATDGDDMIIKDEDEDIVMPDRIARQIMMLDQPRRPDIWDDVFKKKDKSLQSSSSQQHPQKFFNYGGDLYPCDDDAMDDDEDCGTNGATTAANSRSPSRGEHATALV